MVDKFEKWRFRNDGGTIMEADLELWGGLKGQQVIAAEHAIGAIGTLSAPKTSRVTIDGVIIKTILIDLDGLAVLGTSAKDAIGLLGLKSAIGKYVIATDGVCFKVEMTCIVAPTQETTTITQDIDLGADGDDTIVQGGDAIDDIIINTATLVVTEQVTKLTPALTDLDSIFLIEGDTTASTGEYAGGQFMIKFYGIPVIT